MIPNWVLAWTRLWACQEKDARSPSFCIVLYMRMGSQPLLSLGVPFFYCTTHSVTKVIINIKIIGTFLPFIHRSMEGFLFLAIHFKFPGLILLNCRSHIGIFWPLYIQITLCRKLLWFILWGAYLYMRDSTFKWRENQHSSPMDDKAYVINVHYDTKKLCLVSVIG